MSKLNELKERFRAEISRVWGRIQESSLYNRLRDRYENLTPNRQKLVLGGAILVLVLLLLHTPFSFYRSSLNSVSQYENQRSLMKDLFRSQEDNGNQMNLFDSSPSTEEFKKQVEDIVNQAQVLPEQITEVSIMDPPSIIPKNRAGASLRVVLKTLNLRQIVDLGYQISSIHPAVKLVDLSISASTQDPRYFDVIYKFVAFKLSRTSSLPSEDSKASVFLPPKQKNLPKEEGSL